MRIPTGKLNRLLQEAQDRQPPPGRGTQHLRIYYATQTRVDPPTFLLYVNNPNLMHFSYLRYLENRIREQYPYLGTPIRLVLKARKRR